MEMKRSPRCSPPGRRTCAGRNAQAVVGGRTNIHLDDAAPVRHAYRAMVTIDHMRYIMRIAKGLQKLLSRGMGAVLRFALPQTLSQGLEKVRNFKTVFDIPPISYAPNDHAPPRAAMVLQVQSGKWKVIAGPLAAQ